MRTIIAGSRTATVEQVAQAIRSCPWRAEITSVLCGMASGADEHGRNWAIEHCIPWHPFPAYWDTHGKAAGPIRNTLMANHADALILVWDGESDGSKDMLKKAQRRGLKIWEFRFGFEPASRELKP